MLVYGHHVSGPVGALVLKRKHNHVPGLAKRMIGGLTHHLHAAQGEMDCRAPGGPLYNPFPGTLTLFLMQWLVSINGMRECCFQRV